MPELAVEWTSISKITPYEQNPRHNKSAVDSVAKSIKEYGWRQPIVVDDDLVVIAGHTRLLAAKRLKCKRVPVHTATGLTPEQVRAYRLMDNRSAEDASWDPELLALELNDLLTEDFDLSLTGFTNEELDHLLGLGGVQEDEDVIPENVEPRCNRGDIWQLGPHRLACGDATNRGDVLGLLGDVRPHLMVTDPPYGVNYDPAWRVKFGLNSPDLADKRHGVMNDDNADWTEAWRLFPGDIAYVWHGGLHTTLVEKSLHSAGFVVRAQIIWVKDKIVIGRGNYHWQHEPCWYCVREKAKGNWLGNRKQSTVWQFDRVLKLDLGHGTQKPVEAMRRPLVNNSKLKDTVYDPFLGSGTTMIACQTEGRVCYGMDLDPAYCDVAIERWETFTGEKASLVT